MAKSDLNGSHRIRQNKVSHSNIKTRRWQHPNLQERRIYVPELRRFVRLTLTTREIRTLDKLGIAGYVRKLGLDLNKL
jgi:large subunit ribosomal protein L28